jgi:hypothetical protein
MHFRLDPEFFSGKPKPHSVRIRIVYLDESAGSWALCYHNGEEEKVACKVRCGNSGEWKERRVELHDAVFDNRLSGKADLTLEHVEGDDTVFHIIEVDHLASGGNR